MVLLQIDDVVTYAGTQDTDPSPLLYFMSFPSERAGPMTALPVV